MSDMGGSALVRRHIGRRFVALRAQAGITQEQAAVALQRGRATLGRIEDGDERVRFRDVDVRAMVELYQASGWPRSGRAASPIGQRRGSSGLSYQTYWRSGVAVMPNRS